MAKAWDADDSKTAKNAILTYYLEKNAVSETKGAPIFRINAQTGEIKTNICCLDRESTYQYDLQVVAIDGGGLKGTGSVAVRLSDVNDNTPQFMRREWMVVINETDVAHEDNILFEISVNDQDTSNDFQFRIVEASGWGSDFFGIKTNRSVGQVYSKKVLDYEQESQREGFRFLVEVTDKGSHGWYDEKSINSAWVNVYLKDINDNAPVFYKRNIHLKISENILPDTLIASIKATDPDQDGNGSIAYRLAGDFGYFYIRDDGMIYTRTQIDREGPQGSKVVLKVTAVDDGSIRLTSTATIRITILDVNDSPPRILGPLAYSIRENMPSSKVASIVANDDDVWALGNGPPFKFALGKTNSKYILNNFDLKFIKEMDSGRGGAEIWTKNPLDREDSKENIFKIVVSDAKNLSAITEIRIVTEDVNDNLMEPGSKNIFLWKTEGSGPESSIGRVFVEDADDWDISDKSFEWNGFPNSFFTLDQDTGVISASSLIREGKYELMFFVSDSFTNQTQVSANVTVHVSYLSRDALVNAVPVAILQKTPEDISRNWVPGTFLGGIGAIKRALNDVLEEHSCVSEIISIFEDSAYLKRSEISEDLSSNKTIIWVAAKDGRTYMDPVKLRGIIELNDDKLEEQLKMEISTDVDETEAPKNMEPSNIKENHHLVMPVFQGSPGGLQSNYTFFEPLPLMALPLHVVDTNKTSIVTPHLKNLVSCPVHNANREEEALRRLEESCSDGTCLNGGRCVPSEIGHRCVCPANTWGERCKIVTRKFSGKDFVWPSAALPSCMELSLEMDFKPHSGNGLLLYSGPLASYRQNPLGKRLRTERVKGMVNNESKSSLFAVQLINNKIELLAQSPFFSTKLTLPATGSLENNTWHNIKLAINNKGIYLNLNNCISLRNASDLENCNLFKSWPNIEATKGQHTTPWQTKLPLQVGGMISSPTILKHILRKGTLTGNFNGCISWLRINRKVVDFGRPSYVFGNPKSCGIDVDGKSQRQLVLPCETCFLPYLATERCLLDDKIVLKFKDTEYLSIPIKVEMKFSRLKIKIRYRTTNQNYRLVQLSSSDKSAYLRLEIIDSKICLTYKENTLAELISNTTFSSPAPPSHPRSDYDLNESLHNNLRRLAAPKNNQTIGDTTRRGYKELAACLSFVNASDGKWHSVVSRKLGYDLFIELDEKDDYFYNTTVYFFNSLSLKSSKLSNNLVLDGDRGMLLGDKRNRRKVLRYNFNDQNGVYVTNFHLNEYHIPLVSPANNSEPLSREKNCSFVHFCEATQCKQPFKCRFDGECRCSEGHTPVNGGCKPYHACANSPCLHGGSCSRQSNRALCYCQPSYTGKYCQTYLDSPREAVLDSYIFYMLTASALVFLLGMVAVFFTGWRRHKSKRRSKFEDKPDKSGPEMDTFNVSLQQPFTKANKNRLILSAQTDATIEEIHMADVHVCNATPDYLAHRACSQ